MRLLRSCAGIPATSDCTVNWGPATPITRNHWSLTLTYLPTGSSAPKSVAVAASPSTATGAAAVVSASSKKCPDATCRFAIVLYDGVTPYTTGRSVDSGRGSSFDGV